MVPNELAMTETYHDVERMVCKICWNAVRHYGGEFEEYLSIANAAFCAAYRDHDSNRGAFTTICWNYITWSIRSMVMSKRDIPTEDLSLVPAREPRGLWALFPDLGDDAKTVVSLILDPPEGLHSIRKFRKPANIKRVLRRYLARALEWPAGRTSMAFEEIVEVV